MCANNKTKGYLHQGDLPQGGRIRSNPDITLMNGLRLCAPTPAAANYRKARPACSPDQNPPTDTIQHAGISGGNPATLFYSPRHPMSIRRDINQSFFYVNTTEGTTPDV